MILHLLPPPTLLATPPALATDPFPLLRQERLGDLAIGSPAAAVERAIPCPLTRRPPVLWGADGRLHRTWEAPACGLRVDLVGDAKAGAPTVASISLVAPSGLRTRRGIGIGSPLAEVQRAYAKEWNHQESQQFGGFVAGSVYGGLVIGLRNGRVSSIVLGAVAE
jgi:hypothetical protein